MNGVHPSHPTVWTFLACDRIDRQGGGPYSLTRVRWTIPNPLGQESPRAQPELWFYLVLTDAVGKHKIQMTHTCLRDQTKVYKWPIFEVDMGDDPTIIHEIPMQFTKIIFWEPGQSEFELYCGNVCIAQTVIDVR